MIRAMINIGLEYSDHVNVFFIFAFLGWVMECIVIRREKGFWENRGFVHGPFCIIYGFGSMIGYALLQPLGDNYILIYLVGAVCATIFEFLSAKLMIRVVGDFWWDYSNKPFNYKGILCLESTLGWGFVSLLVLVFLHEILFNLMAIVPQAISAFTAISFLVGYSVDFAFSFYKVRKASIAEEENQFIEV